MSLHAITLIGKGLLIIAALAGVVYLFKKAGEKYGFFLTKKAKVGFLGVGLVIVTVLNLTVFIDHAQAPGLERFDFAFLLAFVPFCFGMWGESKAGD
jgi:hypothetical protein